MEPEAVATMAAAAAAGTQIELPLTTIPAEPEISAPTISAAERATVDEDARAVDDPDVAAEGTEDGDASPGTISISPVKHTGDLEEEKLDDAVEEFRPEPAPPRPSYENYILPHSTFLTPAEPPIEQKEAELRALATELQE